MEHAPRKNNNRRVRALYSCTKLRVYAALTTTTDEAYHHPRKKRCEANKSDQEAGPQNLLVLLVTGKLPKAGVDHRTPLAVKPYFANLQIDNAAT